MIKERILLSHPIYQKFKKPDIVGCIIEIEENILTLKCPNEKSLNTLKNDINILNYLGETYNAKKILVETYKEEIESTLPINDNYSIKASVDKPQFKDEFITEPYFHGPSNDFAYKSIAQALKSGSGAIVIAGNVGVGKSHMLHRFTYKAYKQGWNVYINSTAKFISQVFQEYSNKNYDITNSYLKYDLLALDDFQVIDKKHLVSNVHDIFFDILNSFIVYDKLVLLSCDRHPREFEFLHQRITDRLWGVKAVGDPDKIIMNKYIRWFKRKYNLKPKGFDNIILNNANTMRMLKEFLYAIKYLEESNMLTIKSFEDMTKVKIDDIYSIILNKLMQHYKVKKDDLFKNMRRTSIGTKIYSILYYIFYNQGKYDMNTFSLRFNISKNNKNYYLKNGKKYFKEEIENTVTDKEIKSIMSEYDYIN